MVKIIDNHDKLSKFIITILMIIKRTGISIKQNSLWILCLPLTLFGLFSSYVDMSDILPSKIAGLIKWGHFKKMNK